MTENSNNLQPSKINSKSKKPLRIIYFGTPHFAAEILVYLLDKGIVPVAVVTKEDKPVGRSQAPKPPAVKAALQERSLDIPVYQPAKVSTLEMEETLRSHQADLFVVVAYGEIVKQNILDIPEKGCINVHASLLPKLRGASPIQQAIIEGHHKSGVTIMNMVMKMDAGDILATAEVPITPSMTSGELAEELLAVSGPLLLDTIEAIADETIQPTPQNHDAATYVKKITTQDCRIDWSKDASTVHNLIRGLQPKPCAWTEAVLKDQTKRIKIHSSHVSEKEGTPGDCSKDEQGRLLVYCGSGAIVIETLQVEGKKKMCSSEFLRGSVVSRFVS